MSKENKIDAIAVILFILFGLYLGWPGMYTIFLIIFLWAIFSKTPGYYLIYPVLVLFILIPLAISQGKKSSAEHLAIYAFYFLVVMVFLEVREMLNKNR